MDRASIEKVIEQVIDGTDLFVVDIVISPFLDIEVVMDSDTRVSIEQCITITKAIEAAFDREQEDYSLTVGSAGVGSPIKLSRQFDKILNRDVQVVLRSGAKVVGELMAHDDSAVTIRYMTKELVEGKKRKVDVEKTEKYNFLEIKTVCEALFV